MTTSTNPARTSVAAATLQGPRPRNEDRCYAWSRGSGESVAVVAVADGMGGHAGGDIAAEAAIAVVCAAVQTLEGSSSVREWLASTFTNANARVLEAATHDGADGAGTTLTVAVLLGERLTIGHVGDSRAYWLNSTGLHQLTRDHSVGEDAVQRGLVSRDQVRNYPYQHALLRSLGGEAQVEVEIAELDVSTVPDASCTVLLCTDGVWGALDESDLARVLRDRASVDDSAAALVSQAVANGSGDNASVALLKRGTHPASRSALRNSIGLLAFGTAVAVLLLNAAFFQSRLIPSRTDDFGGGRTIWFVNGHPTELIVRDGTHILARIMPGTLQPLHLLRGDSLMFFDQQSSIRPLVVFRLDATAPDTVRIDAQMRVTP
jgi:PPM family protein phosphatase